ncbi:hypothetical protein CHELA40_10843 [Chelatococcus asaccharovorans]|nr:hypothetical protein CHELA40_10843 [Chelatococcus asaccharovorans]
MLRFHCRERQHGTDCPRIIERDIQAAKGVLGGSHCIMMRALFRDIACDSLCLSAGFGDFTDQLIQAILPTRNENHRGPVRCKQSCRCLTNS